MKPIRGVKVLELGTLIARPFCTPLGSSGRRSSSGSPPMGDPLRQWRKLHQGNVLWWSVQARNKIPDGQSEASGGLAIVRHGGRGRHRGGELPPGVLEKLGLGWDVLSTPANPGLVMVRLSGFGQTGPYKKQAGFGRSASRWAARYITGFPDRPPVRTGISIGDSIAALWAAIGADGPAPPRGEQWGRAGGRRWPLRGRLRDDGEHGARSSTWPASCASAPAT